MDKKDKYAPISAVRVVKPAFDSEKTVLNTCGLMQTGGGELSAVDVKNGRIVRIRPLHFDEEYTKEELAPSLWNIEARGKVFKMLMKSLPGYFDFAYKKRVYSPNRIKYPLKRVDWEPEEGKRNPQNRGKSKFKRISWDEATDIIASEIKRVQAKYGPYGILHMSGGHGETKTVQTRSYRLLLDKIGGCTNEIRNADSWEGWYWGTEHVWGTASTGLVQPGNRAGRHNDLNLLIDISENTDMIVWQGGDWETTPQGFRGQGPSRTLYWFTELGIKQVYICPDLNYAAAVHADKWIPILPNTDVALQLAIIYTWITEGTYDKDYVATHTVGFNKVQDYVLGKEDGIPKTPAWASPRCGVPEWTIKALAREWASKRTSVAHYCGGPFIRGPYAHEPARFEAILLGMQGLGKPGVNQICEGNASPPAPEHMPQVRRASPGARIVNKREQIIPRTLTHWAILHPPVSSWGTTEAPEPVEDQFVKYTYPIPEEKGGTEIHMIMNDGPCWTTCWNGGFMMSEAFRSPKVECIVASHMSLEDDAVFADIVLPVCTKMEADDISASDQYWGQHEYGLWLNRKAIEPLGESMSDYEGAGQIARKLGVYEAFTGGKTVEEWLKYGWEISGMKDIVSWEKLNEKGFYLLPFAPDWQEKPRGMIEFYKDPVKNPLRTPSGKLEFYSERLAEKFPADRERGPMPKWVVGGPGWTHDESLWGERCKKYPLLLMSNHPRWRVHAQCDDMTWLREIPTCKVKGFDGYMYQPVWLHPTEAAKRGIESGDIVKLYNERGAVLCGAIVMERIIPGAASVDHGARVDLISDQLDRGGAINLIGPEKGLSENCWGMPTSGYLVEAEKVTMAQMEEWQKQYPEAFQREYHPASGLRFNAWVE